MSTDVFIAHTKQVPERVTRRICFDFWLLTFRHHTPLSNFLFLKLANQLRLGFGPTDCVWLQLIRLWLQPTVAVDMARRVQQFYGDNRGWVTTIMTVDSSDAAVRVTISASLCRDGQKLSLLASDSVQVLKYYMLVLQCLHEAWFHFCFLVLYTGLLLVKDSIRVLAQPQKYAYSLFRIFFLQASDIYVRFGSNLVFAMLL